MLTEEFNWRDVIHETRFDHELTQLASDARRADEFVDGAIMSLARDARAGCQIAPGSPVWMLSAPNAPTVTPMILYYTFNEHHVHLLSLQLTKFGSE